MAIAIPELELVQIIERGLAAIKLDYDDKTDKNTTILNDMFSNQNYPKYNLLEEAVHLFVERPNLTQDSNNRKITVRSYYDRNIRQTPAIHIAAPAEEDYMNAFGFGATDQYLDISNDPTQSTYHSKKCRRYKSRHAIVFTSDNHVEVQLMYFLVKHLLEAIIDELTLGSFQNPKLAGYELKIETDKAPEHFYTRSLVIESFYESTVPDLFSSQSFKSIMMPRSSSTTSGAIGDTCLQINP